LQPVLSGKSLRLVLQKRKFGGIYGDL